MQKEVNLKDLGYLQGLGNVENGGLNKTRRYITTGINKTPQG